MTGIGVGAGLGVLAGRSLSYSPLTLSTRFNQVGVGDNETVSHNNHANFHINAQLPKTVGCWYKCASDITERVLLSKFDSLSSSGWFLSVFTNDLWYFHIRQQANWISKALDAPVGVDGAWHSVIATYSGSQTAAGQTIYIDGVAPPQSNFNAGVPTNFATAEPFKVSGVGNAGVQVNDWTGYACHEFIIAEELTPAEVLLIGGQGVPTHIINALPTRTVLHWDTLGDGNAVGGGGYLDISGNGLHGTYLNGDAGDIQGDVPP